MTHGTRASYQQGCRLPCCQAAEAIYRANIRRQHARGRPPLGVRIQATATLKRLRQLKPEMFSEAKIAQALGLRNRSVRVHAVITLRKALRVQRLYRETMGE